MRKVTLALQDKWVVVTRPKHQAGSITKTLEEAGAHVILFPLLEINPPDNFELSKQRLDKILNYDLVIFISPNAVEQGLKWLNPSSLQGLEVTAVGAKTSALLTQYGMRVDFSPKGNFNSEALLALPEMRNLGSGKKIAILRGEGGRDFLKEQLELQGCNVDYINLYKRSCPQKNLEVLKEYHKNKQLDIILLTSGTSAAHLFLMKDKYGNNDWLNDTCLLAGSNRIKQQVLSRTSHRGELLSSSNPSDETIYQKLLEWSKST
ncbi:MAG TPA: uroporphyrinogen-III synthase [Leucothrix sp.]|nr:uroporphyrinogen-III synthase [Leucothrix sp.]